MDTWLTIGLSIQAPATALAAIDFDYFMQAMGPAIEFMTPVQIQSMANDLLLQVQTAKTSRREEARWQQGRVDTARGQYGTRMRDLGATVRGLEADARAQNLQRLQMFGDVNWGAAAAAPIYDALALRAGGTAIDRPAAGELPQFPSAQPEADIAIAKAYEFAGLGTPDTPMTEEQYVTQRTQ